MTDLLDYGIDSLTSSVFDSVDPTRMSIMSRQQTDRRKQKDANYVDIITLISSLTTPTEIDYQLIADFFLTYRSFISSKTLLMLLVLRIHWCLGCVDDDSHEHKQSTGKLTLIRTFVVLRHWLINYFAEDFVSSGELRQLFVEEINQLTHSEVFVQRVVGSLKKTWTESCNQCWDERVSSADYYNFEIKLGPQSTRSKRLSAMALSQQNDPMTRNSMMLATYEKNVAHQLPIPIPISSKRKPNLFLNPKNSNLRLSMLARTSPTSAFTTVPAFSPSSRSPTSPISPRSPSDPLYIPLLSVLDPKSRNIIRDECKFPISSTLSKVLPPTPVKKMDIVVPLPPPSKPQPKGLRPLIERWIKTFQIHSNAKSHLQTAPLAEKFMASVVSVAKPTSEELEKLVVGKFDILSARSIDELEHLVRFHNEIIARHTSVTGKDPRNSFSFTVPGSKENIKSVSNIDNMNVCETISNISKSVVSLQQHLDLDTRSCKSYVSYDSMYSKRHQAPLDSKIDGALKKKSGKNNLREFNFEDTRQSGSPDQNISRDGDDEKFEFEEEEQQDSASLVTSPTSILSESTPSLDDQTSATEGAENVISDEKEPLTSTILSPSNLKEGDLGAPNTINHSFIERTQDGNANVAVEILTPIGALEDMKEEAIEESRAESNDENGTKGPADNSDHVSSNVEHLSHSGSLESFEFHDSQEHSSIVSDYDEIESFVSTYEKADDENEDDSEQAGAPEIEESELNHIESIAVEDEPSTPPHHEGLISSTPQISPVKTIQEDQKDHQKEPSWTSVHQHSSKERSSLDLNRLPSFKRISDGSISSKYRQQDDNRVSYLSKRSIKSHKTSMSVNSIFSGPKTSHLVNISVEHEHENELDSRLVEEHIVKQEVIAIDIASMDVYEERVRSVSLVSDDFQVPYPGVDCDAIAELAAISDESYQDDPINAALQKLEGQYKKKERPSSRSASNNSSVDTGNLTAQVQDLAIHTPIGKKDSTIIDQKRKTKLFSLTPVRQKDVNYDESSSKILLELMLTYKTTSDILQVSNSEHHVSFILNFDSQTLAEQFTLIEKDALLEIDWKELVELNWESEKLVPINSWLELLVQSQDIQGVDLCVSRFNLTVNWIISEILLTGDASLRRLTIQRFIHIAKNCKALQNYSTLMQILLALGSDKVMKLKETWRLVEPGDLLIYKSLESISSPLKNFMNLRLELNKIKPSAGCVPFLGLYLSDLIFNKEKRSVQDGLINYGKFKHTSKIVKSLIQCIQWSMLYKLECKEDVLNKCLYIKALSEEEMDECLTQIS